MLDNLFLSLLNMSLVASYVIIFVLLARLVLKKAPKVFSYALWSIVLLRLICPFSFESEISVLPTTIQQNTALFQWTDDYVGLTNTFFDNRAEFDIAVSSGRVPISAGEDGFYVVTGADGVSAPKTVGNTVIPKLSYLWILGIIAMAVYSIVAFVKLKRSLITATPLKENIYLADHISTAFVLGVIKPKIYLPSSLLQSEQDYIIRHELCHIKRLDHITRILGFIALSVHWFNPLVWVAFALSGKDMELSCDEAVMKSMDTDIKAEYSQSLLRFSTTKKMMHATPLAFGESDTKSRVKNVLDYKKPKFWVVLITALLCVVAVFCLVSNPKSKAPPTLYAYSENGVIPMNLGTYSWNGVVADSISYTEMDYENIISYNDGHGHRNANIFFSTSNNPSGFNTDNAKGTDKFEIVEMKRFVNDKEETLHEFSDNMILVSLEQDTSYLYSFKVQFGENHAYYSIKINNNVQEPSEPFISKVTNGMVSSTLENEDLAKEIVMKSLAVSAAWEGVDIDALDNYYHIHYLIAEDSTIADYYVFILDGKPVLQFGKDGRYIMLNDGLYKALTDLFQP